MGIGLAVVEREVPVDVGELGVEVAADAGDHAVGPAAHVLAAAGVQELADERVVGGSDAGQAGA